MVSLDTLLGPKRAPGAEPRAPLAPRPSQLDQLLGPKKVAPGARTPGAVPGLPGASEVSAERPSIAGEFTQGVQAGVRQLGVDFTAVKGLGAQVFGAADIANDLQLLAQEKARGIQADLPATVSFEEAFSSPSNFTRWAARLLGEQVPVLGSVIVGGGVGGIIGRLVGRGALSLGQGLAGAKRFGQTAGAIGAITGLETGGSAREQFDVTGEVNPTLAIAAGLVKGSLEAIVPLAFVRRFGLAGGQADDLLSRITAQINRVASRPRRIAAAGGAVAVTEAATEITQEAVDIAVRGYIDENFDVLGPEARARLLESVVSGGFVGLILGGAGGAIGGRVQAQETPITDELPPIAPPRAPQGEPGVEPEGIEPGSSPIAPPAPVVFAPQVAAVTPEDLAGDAPIAFEPAEQTQFTQAAKQRNSAAVRLVQTPREGQDTSALVEDLPVTEDESFSSDRISFIEGTTKAQQGTARMALRRAIKARNLELGGQTQRTPDKIGAVQLNLARVAYQSALDGGLRVEPREDAGFLLLGKDRSGFQTIEDLDISPEGLTEGLLVDGGQIVDLPEGGEVSLSNKLRPVDRLPDRQFKVNKERLAAIGGRISSASIDGLAQAGILSGTETDPTVTPERLTVEQLQERIDAAPGISIVEGSSIERILRNVNAARTEVVARVVRGRLEQAVQAGLQIDPTEATSPGDLVVVSPTQRIGLALTEVPVLPANFARTSRVTQFKTTAETLLRAIGVRAEPKVTDLVNVLEARTKKSYNPANHKPGTAVLIYDNNLTTPFGGEKAQFLKVEQLYTKLLKDFGMSDVKLLIAADGIGKEQLGGSNGSFSPSTTDIGLVLIKTGRALPQFANTVAHEFGHAMVWAKFSKTPHGLQRKVLNGYNRALIRASLGDTRDFALSFLGPTRAQGFSHLDEIAKRATEILKNTSSGPNYWLSFDEYMAEQVARWMTLRRQPATTLERFFRGLARRMKELVQRTQVLFNTESKFIPEREAQLWIESLRGQREAEVSVGANALETGAQESLAENAKTFGEHATPGSEASQRTDSMLRALDVDPAKRRELRASTDRISRLSQWGFNLRQMAGRNLHIEGLQRYRELIEAWYVQKMQWTSRADTRVREWRSISVQSQENLARFLFELDAMGYLKPGEQARQPSEAELRALAKKHKLTTEAFVLFGKIREDFDAILDKIQEVAIRNIRERAADPNAVGVEVTISRIKADMNKLRSRPYFPHTRFGEFAVVVKRLAPEKDETSTAYMQQFETEKAARAGFAAIRARFGNEAEFSVRLDKMPEEVLPFRGMPPAVLEGMRGLPGVTKDQQTWIDNFVAELSPEQSFRRRLSKREDIPGFSLDAMRSYANYFWHGSNYLARLEFNKPLSDAIDTVRATASDPAATQNLDVTKRRKIVDFMQNHFNEVLYPGADWAQLRSIAFMWYLGFSPASAAVNLTQIPLVTLPYLSARFGDLRAMNALRRATFDLQRLYKNKTDNISDDYILAQSEAIAEGVTSESQATELAATAEGSNLARLLPGDKFHRAQMQFAHWSAFLFQASEGLNRRLSFKAGYDLAVANPTRPYLQELQEQNTLRYKELRAKGFSEQGARAYLAGRDVVWASQFQYANHARPRFMRGRKGLFFTFFMFTQQMVWFAAHSPGRTRYLLMLLAAAGLMGLPGAEDMSIVAKFIGAKLFGKDWNAERELRKLSLELLGDGIAPDLVLHGTSRIGFGIPHAFDLMGVPFPQFDISARLGMGQIIPGIGLFEPGLEFDARFSRAVTDAAGATLGIGINIAKALSDTDLPASDMKRWERAMPSAARNMVKAIRFANEGRERRGDLSTVLEFDASDPYQLAEIVAQAMGFAPTRLSRVWDRERMKQEAVMYWGTRRGMLLRQYDHALEVRSKAASQDVLAAIRRFNNEVPFAAQKITPAELRRSRIGRIKRRRKRELGFPASKRDIPISREIDKLFPEVEDASRFR